MKKSKKKDLKKQLLKKPQYQIANTRMRRFFALIIDWYLTTMLASIPITFYLRGDSYLKAKMFDFTNYNSITAYSLIAFGLMIGLIYYIIIPTYLWKGQTIGKKICQIKIVKENGNDITFSTLLLRELVGSTFLEGGIVIMATYLRKILPFIGLSSFVSPLQYLAYALTIISIIYAYFNPLSQSFHDKLAKTIVIKKN